MGKKKIESRWKKARYRTTERYRAGQGSNDTQKAIVRIATGGTPALFAGDGEILCQNPGGAEGGFAEGPGELYGVAQGGDVLQQVVEVACHGEGLDVNRLFSVFNQVALALEGEVAGDGVGAGVKAPREVMHTPLPAFFSSSSWEYLPASKYMVKGLTTTVPS